VPLQHSQLLRNTREEPVRDTFLGRGDRQPTDLCSVFAAVSGPSGGHRDELSTETDTKCRDAGVDGVGDKDQLVVPRRKPLVGIGSDRTPHHDQAINSSGGVGERVSFEDPTGIDYHLVNPPVASSDSLMRVLSACIWQRLSEITFCDPRFNLTRAGCI
jgi:hypothetical protein